jgi:uncharacterized protein YebE (UPF0316 family)
MFEYITNPWWSALIVMITQFLFLYLRTKNVIYITNNETFLAVTSGALIGLMWLTSVTFSIDAIMKLEWQPLLAYFIGGMIGTYYAMKLKKIK